MPYNAFVWWLLSINILQSIWSSFYSRINRAITGRPVALRWVPLKSYTIYTPLTFNLYSSTSGFWRNFWSGGAWSNEQSLWSLWSLSFTASYSSNFLHIYKSTYRPTLGKQVNKYYQQLVDDVRMTSRTFLYTFTSLNEVAGVSSQENVGITLSRSLHFSIFYTYESYVEFCLW